MADIVAVFGLVFPCWLSSVKLPCISNFSSQAPERNKPLRNMCRYSKGSSLAFWRAAGKNSLCSPIRHPSPCSMGLSSPEPFVLDGSAEPANQMPLVLVVVVGDLHFKLNRINSVVLVGSSPPAFLLSSHIAKSKKMQWISSQNGSGHQPPLPPPVKAGVLFALRTVWYLLT